MIRLTLPHTEDFCMRGILFVSVSWPRGLPAVLVPKRGLALHTRIRQARSLLRREASSHTPFLHRKPPLPNKHPHSDEVDNRPRTWYQTTAILSPIQPPVQPSPIASDLAPIPPSSRSQLMGGPSASCSK